MFLINNFVSVVAPIIGALPYITHETGAGVGLIPELEIDLYDSKWYQNC